MIYFVCRLISSFLTRLDYVKKAELQEPRHLIALALQVLADLLLGEQRALARLPRWIADQSGSPTHQDDRPVAGALQIGEQHQRHQVADLQAGGGGVEAAVGGDRPAREVGFEARRRLLDEPAPTGR